MGNARWSPSPLQSQVQIRHLTALHLHRQTHSQVPPPKGPWSFTTATRTGKVPLKIPSSPVWVAKF